MVCFCSIQKRLEGMLKCILNLYPNESVLFQEKKNGKLIFKKSLRGKFKDGYFLFRPKFYILPFLPLAYAHNFERGRIGFTEDHQLILDYSKRMWAFALVAGSSEKGRTRSIYNRRK